MSARDLVPGQPVRIIAGLSRGARGEVVRRLWDFAIGIPQYAVALPEGIRPIRSDYLELVGVPS